MLRDRVNLRSRRAAVVAAYTENKPPVDTEVVDEPYIVYSYAEELSPVTSTALLPSVVGLRTIVVCEEVLNAILSGCCSGLFVMSRLMFVIGPIDWNRYIHRITFGQNQVHDSDIFTGTSHNTHVSRFFVGFLLHTSLLGPWQACLKN